MLGARISLPSVVNRSGGGSQDPLGLAIGSSRPVFQGQAETMMAASKRATIAYRHFPATRGIDIDRGPNLSDILLALHRDMIRPRRI